MTEPDRSDRAIRPDLVIRDALLLDGTGAPGVPGDLAVTDDRIAALGDLSRLRGGREIDAGGLALAPGFIDVHTHDDRALLSDPLMSCKASQGVTTVITGNCGISLAPLSVIRRPPQPLGLDVYPYTASSTVLDARRIPMSDRIVVTWSRAHPEFAGKDLADIAAAMGCTAAEAVDRLQPAGAIYFMMSEADVQRVLAYPHTMIGSDGLPHDEHPHPRLWGTFPRVLGHYARDIGLFPLAEAVRRMTTLPAARFGLAGRGTLRPGGFADLVLFDPDAIADRATFDKPAMPAAGISLVMVNGRAVWRGGAATGARPGRVLRRGVEAGIAAAAS